MHPDLGNPEVSTRTAEQETNLRILIKANRESPHELFLEDFGQRNGCNTACCVIGNYADRTDLQSYLKLQYSDSLDYQVAKLIATGGYEDKDIQQPTDQYIQDLFGLTKTECQVIFTFSYDSSSLAQRCETPQQAADYLCEYLGINEN